MTTTGQDIRFISKVNSGFPPHLDWEVLRAIGVDHIGKLSGKLWSDHNVHDPGITILEILCYALMDLGYRTCLPTADILARNEEGWSQSDDFFSSPDLLTCNPVTITDFRKMLIDIPGIRNAWLEDAYYACADGQNNSDNTRETICSDCYNGLYRVSIETEGPNTAIDHPEVRELLHKVRSKLIEHRNICEDFIDIRVLCKKQIGLCADIELEKNTDADQVYQELIAKLSEFFSPAPRFYTLKQMLVEKGKTIEDVFAGRPYNLKESHGFIDTHELENLHLRKELHLSDVFKVLLSVGGVREVSRVGWKEDGSKCIQRDKWVLNIPENHVMVFDPAASVIRFTRQGIPLPIDVEAWNGLLEFTNLNSGKVSYKTPSPYLQADFPKGTFREDLAEYVSVQNDFPRVYGIDYGGLPADAPPRRKAQALQLKGYLLFFDQLLSGYLSQLKNVKSLLSFRSAQSNAEKQTYFGGSLENVPDIEKLMRFQSSDFVAPGTILARPVHKEALERTVQDGLRSVTRCIPIGEAFHYTDPCAAELAVRSWNQEMIFNDQQAVVFRDASGCWRYYLPSQDPDTVLLGDTARGTEAEAKEDADAARFAGKYLFNFKTFQENSTSYSFVLELQLSFHLQYLQQILESPALYLERRNHFLDHLLSRFAERFSEFALLSFQSVQGEALREQEISVKEKFLDRYPDLSSNRGRAYNYQRDGWNNNNLSGFEKRAMALAGMGDLKRKDLCNFVVEKYDEYYLIVIRSEEGEELLKVPERFYSFETAEQALRSLTDSLSNPGNYIVTDETPFTVQIKFTGSVYASAIASYSNQEDAVLLRNGLFRLFNPSATETDVIENTIVVRPAILGSRGNRIASCNRTFDSETTFWEHALKDSDFFNSPENWNTESSDGTSHLIVDAGSGTLINWAGFRANGIYIKDHPNKVSFQLLDIRNSFVLESSMPFDTEEEAAEAAKLVLFTIVNRPDSLRILPVRSEFKLEVRDGDVVMAEGEFDNQDEAESALETIRRIIESNRYHIGFFPEPDSWRYRFITGYGNRQFIFRSSDEYNSVASALSAAEQFYQKVDEKGASISGTTVFLTDRQKKLRASVEATGKEEPSEILHAAKEYLRLRSELKSVFAHPRQQARRFIVNDIGNAKLQWVYRLIDKGNRIAFHTSEQPITDETEKIRNRLFQTPPAYRITEIILSEDALTKTIDSKGKEQFSYQIIQRTAEKHIILFQSVLRYPTRSAAWDGFLQNFMHVLYSARYTDQYGPGRPISLVEVSYDSDKIPYNNQAIVFIPSSTKTNFNEWHDDVAIDELVRIASQYPIRYTSKDQDEFYKLFPCEEDERDKTEQVCQTSIKATRYFYFVLSDENGKGIWQGTQHYTSREQAAEHFRFFLILLNYPGNFTGDQDHCECKHSDDHQKDPCECHPKIFIREVLAESTARYASPQEAWDKLEKFVCIAQDKQTFHAFQRAEDCSNSFDIYCSNAPIHTREYHSAKQRNESLIRLHKAFEEFSSRIMPRLVDAEEGWHVLDAAGEIAAEIVSEDRKRQLCLADFFFLLFKNMHQFQPGIGVEVRDEAGLITIRLPDNAADPERWIRQLQRLAALYPIVREGDGKYYLSILLEGYGLGSPGALTGDCNNQHPAWKSRCGHRTCADAERHLQQYKYCLADVSNYRGTYECDCGPFRVELICKALPEIHTNKTKSSNSSTSDFPVDHGLSHCFNDIIAYNPQRYPTPGMNCDAIERSRRLINSEGLHLVEHILLRPLCPEDCQKGEFVKLSTCFETHQPWARKSLLWKPTSGAWPDNTMDYSFVPGSDPYSFIATVFLPAWPKRFRSAENKLIIENLLQHEIPSHVLLRIFWLRPVDFCEFEGVFKKWNLWVSQGRKSGCLKNNPIGDLVNCLTTRTYTELPECTGCEPSTPEGTRSQGCFEDVADPCANYTFLKNINDLYCWNSGRKSKQARHNSSEDSQTVQPKKVIETKEPRVTASEFFRLRRESYLKNLESVGNKKGAVIEDAISFITKNKPQKDDLILIIKKTIENLPGKGRVKLSDREQRKVIESVVLFYIDKVYYESEKPFFGKQLSKFLATIDNRKLNRRKLFELWNSEDAKNFENKIPPDQIRDILIGK